MYFGIVAVLNGVLNTFALRAPQVPHLLKGMMLLSMAVGGADLYVAFALPTLLRRRPQIVIVVIALLPALAFLVSIVRMNVTGEETLATPIVSSIVAGYLYVNVKRLAVEAATQPLRAAHCYVCVRDYDKGESANNPKPCPTCGRFI
jgi:hypothetical protein